MQLFQPEPAFMPFSLHLPILISNEPPVMPNDPNPSPHTPSIRPSTNLLFPPQPLNTNPTHLDSLATPSSLPQPTFMPVAYSIGLTPNGSLSTQVRVLLGQWKLPSRWFYATDLYAIGSPTISALSQLCVLCYWLYQPHLLTASWCFLRRLPSFLECHCLW